MKVEPRSLIAGAEALVAAGNLADALPLFLEAAASVREIADQYVKITDRVLFLRPGLLPLAHQAARQRLENGVAREALRILQPCFQRDPADITTLVMLGDAFAALGKDAKAASVRAEVARLARKLPPM